MMKEVCVAILDTGIEYNNLLKNNVIEGFGFNNGIKTDDYNDENGHGTKCANIIRMYCDDKVKFIIAKVLNENMEGYEKDILFIYKLVDCLEKCLICRHIRRFAD